MDTHFYHELGPRARSQSPPSPLFPLPLPTPSRSRRSEEDEDEDELQAASFPETMVSVTIVSAAGLRAADLNGYSDPYCVCRIRGVQDSEVRTPFKKKNLNPVWDFPCSFLSDDVRGGVLEFEVWDKDLISHDDPLGKALLHLSPEPCDASRQFEVELPLGGDRKAKGTLLLRLSGARPLETPPPLQEMPSQEPAAQRTLPPQEAPASRRSSRQQEAARWQGPSVTVVRATGVRIADLNGKADPYCVCRFQGERDWQFRTDVVRRTLNPEWNHRHVLADDAHGKVLEFEVWDWDRITRADFLGKAVLPLCASPCDAGRKCEVELPLEGRARVPTLRGSRCHGTLTVSLQGLRPLQESEQVDELLSGRSARAPLAAAADHTRSRAAWVATALPVQPVEIRPPRKDRKTQARRQPADPGRERSVLSQELRGQPTEIRMSPGGDRAPVSQGYPWRAHNEPELLAEGQAAKRKLLQTFTDGELVEELDRRARVRGGQSLSWTGQSSKRSSPLGGAMRSPLQWPAEPTAAEASSSHKQPPAVEEQPAVEELVPPRSLMREQSPRVRPQLPTPPAWAASGASMEMAGSNGGTLRVRILLGADVFHGEHRGVQWQLAANGVERALGEVSQTVGGRSLPLPVCSATAQACYCGRAEGATRAGTVRLDNALRASLDEFCADFQAYPTYGDNIVTTAGLSPGISHMLHVFGPSDDTSPFTATDSIRRACLFAAYVRSIHRSSQLARWHHKGCAALAVTPLSANGVLTEEVADAFALATRAYISAFRQCALCEVCMAIPRLDAQQDSVSSGQARVLESALMAVHGMRDVEFRKALAGVLFQGPGASGPLLLSMVPALQAALGAGKIREAPFKYLGLSGHEGVELDILRSDAFLHVRDGDDPGYFVRDMPHHAVENVPLLAPGDGWLVKEIWLSKGGGVLFEQPVEETGFENPGCPDDTDDAREGPSYAAVISRNSAYEEVALTIFKVALCAATQLSQLLQWFHASTTKAHESLSILLLICIIVSNLFWVAHAANLVYRKVNSRRAIKDYVFSERESWAGRRINMGLYLSLVCFQMFDVPANLYDAPLLLHPWRPARPFCAFNVKAGRAVVVGYDSKEQFKADNWGDSIPQLPRLLFGDLPILALQLRLAFVAPHGRALDAWAVSVALTAASATIAVYEIFSRHSAKLDLGKVIMHHARTTRDAPVENAYIALSRDPKEIE